jgi:hypothetical protein
MRRVMRTGLGLVLTAIALGVAPSRSSAGRDTDTRERSRDALKPFPHIGRLYQDPHVSAARNRVDAARH